MSKEFWEIAEPFLGLTARQITYGDKIQYVKFLAVMSALGFKIDKTGCVRCVGDGLGALKIAHRKDFRVMAEKQTCKLKPLSVVWDGIRYEVDTMTDKVALAMLAQFPNHAQLFEKLPSKEKPKNVAKVAADQETEGAA